LRRIGPPREWDTCAVWTVHRNHRGSTVVGTGDGGGTWSKIRHPRPPWTRSASHSPRALLNLLDGRLYECYAIRDRRQVRVLRVWNRRAFTREARAGSPPSLARDFRIPLIVEITSTRALKLQQNMTVISADRTCILTCHRVHLVSRCTSALFLGLAVRDGQDGAPRTSRRPSHNTNVLPAVTTAGPPETMVPPPEFRV